MLGQLQQQNFFSDMGAGESGRTIDIVAFFIFAETGRAPGIITHKLFFSLRFAMTIEEKYVAKRAVARNRFSVGGTVQTLIAGAVTERELRGK